MGIGEKTRASLSAKATLRAKIEFQRETRRRNARGYEFQWNSKPSRSSTDFVTASQELFSFALPFVRSFLFLLRVVAPFTGVAPIVVTERQLYLAPWRSEKYFYEFSRPFPCLFDNLLTSNLAEGRKKNEFTVEKFCVLGGKEDNTSEKTRSQLFHAIFKRATPVAAAVAAIRVTPATSREIDHEFKQLRRFAMLSPTPSRFHIFVIICNV